MHFPTLVTYVLVGLTLTLDHEYTKKNLVFCNLKGANKARPDSLLRSKVFNLHLALLERHMSGTSVCDPACDYYDGGHDDDEEEEVEDNSDNSEDSCDDDGRHRAMDDKDTTGVIKWINAQDSEVTLSGLDIDTDEEMLSDKALFDSDAKPDREDYESYTGNAGPTLE